jgi:putative mRNA 3-end processing factor
MEPPFKILKEGLFCPAGNFYIDAWQPVPTCVVTHAHGDHAFWGHQRYIATPDTIKILKIRLGPDLNYQELEYGEKLKLGDAWISLHPAGHILGSAQVRIEVAGKVTVVSGDYKRAPDPTCLPFEVVECDIFVTESTFGLPIYQWNSGEKIKEQIVHWWKTNAEQDRPSILFAYTLGKAQRIMSLLANTPGQIYCHGAVMSISQLYKELQIPLIPFSPVSERAKGASFSKDLIIAPPSAFGSTWMRRFPHCRTAFVSGWMEVRGNRRRRAVDTGFVLSDHADWPALIDTIKESKAKIIYTTHGYSATLAKYLNEMHDVQAFELHGLETSPQDED